LGLLDNKCANYPLFTLCLTTSKYTTRWPLRHATLPDNYGLSQKRRISAGDWRVFEEMRRIGRWSFWSCFD